MDDEVFIREVEDYVKQHGIHELLRDSIVNLCLYRPADPISYLREYFHNLEVSFIPLSLTAYHYCYETENQVP